jgi:hypothetical protein
VRYEAPALPPHGFPVGSCPSGEYCVPPSQASASPRAEPPYGECAASVRPPEGAGPSSAFAGFAPGTTASERASAPGGAGACCYHWVVPCPGGRTLREGDHAVVASVAPTTGWRAPRQGSSDEVHRTSAHDLARAWAEEAGYEHASVASFALASLDWMALGAPRALVAEAQRAALDEVEHARALYELASELGEARVGPGRLAVPARKAPSWERVTMETFFDACLNETAAAVVANERAQQAASTRVREALARIARDEARHAELGWRVLSWLVAAGGHAARGALATAVEALEAQGARAAGEPSQEGSRGDGFVASAEEAALRARVVAEVVLPCARAALGG